MPFPIEFRVIRNKLLITALQKPNISCLLAPLVNAQLYHMSKRSVSSAATYSRSTKQQPPPVGLTRKALSVSCMLDSAGDTQQIMSVWLLPPSESWSMRVSFESRYGTCTLPRFVSSPSALITFPKVSNPLLMSTPWKKQEREKQWQRAFTAHAVRRRVPCTRSPAPTHGTRTLASASTTRTNLCFLVQNLTALLHLQQQPDNGSVRGSNPTY